MTNLSPAAQAVLDAFRTSHTGQGCLAAALRTAVDQVAPEQLEGPTGSGFRWGEWATKSGARSDLLAIAAELESTDS